MRSWMKLFICKIMWTFMSLLISMNWHFLCIAACNEYINSRGFCFCWSVDIKVLQQSLVKLKIYLSGIQGFDVYVDDTGDAEGNYSLLTLTRPSKGQPYLGPVGCFNRNFSDSGVPVSIWSAVSPMQEQTWS